MDPQFCIETLELLEPDQLLIVWKDGHESLYPYSLVRRRCGCARCVDEWTGEALLQTDRIPEDIRIVAVRPTGNYGLQLSFSDGHGTGIYTLRGLRGFCPCGECADLAEPGDGARARGPRPGSTS